MLVLSRKVGETIHLGAEVVITVTRIGGDKVRLGIDAPTTIGIRRGELVPPDEHPAAQQFDVEMASGEDPKS